MKMQEQSPNSRVSGEQAGIVSHAASMQLADEGKRSSSLTGSTGSRDAGGC